MIRKWKETDMDRVMQIWLESNLQAHDFIPKLYWKNNYETVEQMLPQAELFVYEKDEQILGFLGMMENYIAGLFVDKKVRSQGIGKALLDHVKKRQIMMTLHVYLKNDRAIRFYNKEGFIIQGEQMDQSTGEAELLMQWFADFI